MNNYLPHIIGVTCLVLGYIFAKFHALKKHPAEAEENGSIQSCWISRHAYRAD